MFKPGVARGPASRDRSPSQRLILAELMLALPWLLLLAWVLGW